MKAMVRDDIIRLESYVEAEFKYKKYIEVIAYCGGYCFLEQIDRIWKDEGGKYLAKKMEDAGLIKSEYYSNYKYVRLTSNALKYLQYREDKRDFSQIPKNKITVRNLSKTPSEKVLFTSTMYFEVSQIKNSINQPLLKKEHINTLNKLLKKNNSNKIKELELKLKKEEELKDILEVSLNSSMEMLGNIQKIEQDLNRIKNNKLEEIEELTNKKFLVKSKQIDKINEEIEVLDPIIKYNELNIDKIKNLKKKLDVKKSDINKLDYNIDCLKEQESAYNEKIESIIDYFIKMRDVSKVIVNPLFIGKYPEDYKIAGINILSFFVKNHKSNYHEIIEEILEKLKEPGIEIIEIRLKLISIKDSSKEVDKLFEKLDKSISNLRNIKYQNVKFVRSYTRLEELEKYFEHVPENTSYIKESDIDIFKGLRNLLAEY